MSAADRLAADLARFDRLGLDALALTALADRREETARAMVFLRAGFNPEGVRAEEALLRRAATALAWMAARADRLHTLNEPAEPKHKHRRAA